MSHFPAPPEPDPERAGRPASGHDATGPVPEADDPTLVMGEPVPEADAPTQENAVVQVREEPVFVDTSGRRRTILRRVGIGIGALAVAYLALFVVSLAGGPRPPGIPLPEAVAGDPDQTQTEPDGTAPGTPAIEPTPGGSPASTAGSGSADASPSAVPPGVAPAPAPAPPVATPVPTTTPAPTTTSAPTTTPTPAPSPLVTDPAPAADLTEPSQP